MLTLISYCKRPVRKKKISNNYHLFTALQLGGLPLFCHFAKKKKKKKAVVSFCFMAAFESQEQISVGEIKMVL